MEFHSATLDNGLEIVAESNPNSYSMGMAFFVNTGSRDEMDPISGVSHFLEHMAFKGTPSRSAADVNRELDEMGSHSNAYTSEEHTVYFATILPEFQDRTVNLLSDILRPSLRDEDFHLEKKVIIEEIYKYDDQPPFGAHEKCMTAHFGNHPLGRSILGTVDTVQGLTPDAMRDYFERRYHPGNIKLVAAGSVDFPRLVDVAQQCCGHWQRHEEQKSIAGEPSGLSFDNICKDSAAQQYAVQIANGPSATDDNRFAARVLATILGDDSGSRLYWDLTETGLAEYAGISTYEFKDAGIYMIFLCCAPEQTSNNLQRIQNILREAEKTGISESELNRAKSKICSHVVLASERPSNRLFSIGGDWIQRGNYRSVKQIVDAYQAVTTSDVASVLEKFPLTQNTTVSIGPLDQLERPV